MSVVLRALVLVGATLAISAICAKYAPAPFIWILLIWTGAMSYLAWHTARVGIRAALINLAAVFATLAGMEAWAYLSINSDPMIGRSYSAAYRVRDDVLGTVPAREPPRDRR